MPASSSRSRSTMACSGCPVASSCSASGSALSHAAYSAWSLSSVATAACHCCARLARRIGRAGIAFKVHEALSYGLPVVSSMRLSNQLAHTGESNGAVIPATVNDCGRAFPAACTSLLSDDRRWHRAGLDYIMRCCAPSALADAVCGLIWELRHLRNGGERPNPHEKIRGSTPTEWCRRDPFSFWSDDCKE
jgi:hypothetical protein